MTGEGYKNCEVCGSQFWASKDQTKCKRCLVKGDLSWAERLNQLNQRKLRLESKIAGIDLQMKPFLDKIENLKQALEPFYKRRQPLGEEVFQLKWKTNLAKDEALIESLKVGDELWILQAPWGDRNLYETITEEQAQTRFEKRSKGESKPHRLTIIKFADKYMVGIDENKREYVSSVRRGSGSNYLTRLEWRSIQK